MSWILDELPDGGRSASCSCGFRVSGAAQDVRTAMAVHDQFCSGRPPRNPGSNKRPSRWD